MAELSVVNSNVYLLLALEASDCFDDMLLVEVFHGECCFLRRDVLRPVVTVLRLMLLVSLVAAAAIELLARDAALASESCALPG